MKTAPKLMIIKKRMKTAHSPKVGISTTTGAVQDTDNPAGSVVGSSVQYKEDLGFIQENNWIIRITLSHLFNEEIVFNFYHIQK